MERNLKEVFQQAAQLPDRDRATLVGLLIETLDPVSESDVEAAWSEEIKKRLATSFVRCKLGPYFFEFRKLPFKEYLINVT